MALTKSELEFAYKFWVQRYGSADLDERLAEGGGPYLKDIRAALRLSTNDVADRMGISRSAYHKLEKNEEREAISINSLRRVAEALDCELVYTIRPKHTASFSEMLWQRIYFKIKDHPWLRNCDPKKKANALAGLAREATPARRK